MISLVLRSHLESRAHRATPTAIPPPAIALGRRRLLPLRAVLGLLAALGLAFGGIRG